MEEAERRAAIAEHLGCGGSCFESLDFLAVVQQRLQLKPFRQRMAQCSPAMRPSSAVEAERSASFTQCSSQVNEMVLEALPSIQAHSQDKGPNEKGEPELCSLVTEGRLALLSHR